jgi:putative oxidoreductase
MKKNIVFVICLLFGLMMINAGLDKFLHYMPMPSDMPEEAIKAFNAFKEIGWLLPLVGIAELVGGILFIIPKTRALGAIVILPIVVGILLANMNAPSGLPIAIVLILINLWIIYENRDKYLHLLN